jgi:hypothetical protein
MPERSPPGELERLCWDGGLTNLVPRTDVQAEETEERIIVLVRITAYELFMSAGPFVRTGRNTEFGGEERSVGNHTDLFLSSCEKAKSD